MPRLSRLVVLTLLATASLAAQQPTFDFSIRNMMRGPEIYGREPSNVRWSPDGQWIYFQWLPAGTDWRENPRPYRVRAQAGATPERVTEAHMDSVGLSLATGPVTADRSKRVVEYRGDLYLVTYGKGGTTRRLTETNAQETQPRFSSDGQKVLFVRDGNAYSMELAGGLTKQLTDIRTSDAAAVAATPALGGRGGGGGGGGRQGGAGAPPARGGGAGGTGGATTQRGALEADQRRLFEVIRDQARADSIRRAEAAARPAAALKSVTLAANERLQQLSVSPNGSAVVFTTTTAAADARNGIVPNYVTASGYTEDIPNRTKVGDAQATGRIGFQSLPGGDVKWLRPIDSDSAANGTVVGWNDSGTHALIVGNARNFKTRQLSTVDAATGTVKAIEVLKDTAWVGGPCGFGCAGFYDTDKRVYFVSEANGFAQLYSTALDGSDRQALSGAGKYEIYDVALSADRKSFFFHSSEQSSFDRDLYRMPITGGARQKLTVGLGGHQAVLSPDEKQYADVYSTTTRSPDLFLQAACPPTAQCKLAPAAQLTVSQTADYLAFKWIAPPIVMIPASDGVQVPAHIYKPQDIGAQPNGAAVIFVHGAGYLHNVGNFWSQYPREYMFNNYLASKGYVVLDIDYRASAGYGRDWRTAIYRWMGGRDLQDQVDGSKYLTKTFGIDPERIGMYGGSYGGFMTLMALFTEPKYFGSGAALRSVTDWAHYNHGYTGQILNLPQNDSVAYRRSSPIFLAEGLEDPLLMLHGMVDTNVNFQDIVRLTQRLIELGKTDWWLAPYPVEDHGFTRPSSWTDEYTRIFQHFESTIGPKGSKVRR
jgi:dipeptidyl aminopeptidase/acylaminoacyl peptidase